MILSVTLYSSAEVVEKVQSYNIKYTYTEGTPDPYESQGDNGFDFKSLMMVKTYSVMQAQYNHNIHNQDDVDVIGFPVYIRTKCEIRLFNIPENCDYDLELYSADDTSNYIAKSANCENYDELITKILEPGFYFAKVHSYRGYSNQPYGIKIDRSHLPY